MRGLKIISSSALVVSLMSLFMSASCIASVDTAGNIKKINQGIKDIKSRSAGERRRGYETLKSIGNPTVPYLVELLQNEVVPSQTKRWTCNLLAELKAKDGVPALINTLGHKVSTVRVASAKALGVIQDDRAIKPLLQMLGDDQPEVRKWAIVSLMNFDNPQIPIKVATLLTDEDYSIRIAAINLLKIKKDPSTSANIREAVKSEEFPMIRRLAAQLLGEIKDIDSVDILIDIAIEDTDRFVREDAIIALGQIGDQKAIPVLVEAVADEYKNIQIAAADSLKSITGEDFSRDYAKWSEWNNARK